MSIQFQSQYLRETKVKEMSVAAGAGPILPALNVPAKKYKGPEMKTEDAPMLAAGKADISTYTQDNFKKVEGRAKLKSIDVKDLWKKKPTAMSNELEEDDYDPTDDKQAEKDEILNEARGYSQFKKETATRTKPQQMHEAAKLINKKLDEINKLLEYTNQMRSDLSEGEEQLEYKHNTKSLFEKMHRKVIETYTKLKKIK